MSTVDPRTLTVGQKVVVMITGCVGNHHGTVTGHDAREGLPIVTVDDGVSTWNGVELKREDYVVLQVLDESEPKGGVDA